MSGHNGYTKLSTFEQTYSMFGQKSKHFTKLVSSGCCLKKGCIISD